MVTAAKKPAKGTFIVVKFQNQEGERSPPIKIKSGSKLKKAFNKYAAINELPVAVLIFAFDGEKLLGEETPDQLEMSSDDLIDVFMHRHGGGGV